MSCVVGQIFNTDSESSKVSNAGDTVKTQVANSEETPPATDAPVATEEAVPEPAAIEPAAIVPDFTIARAAADGSVVIVGTAAVGATVVVKSDGKILGKTKPESSGEWVFVPENPLPTGGVEITVEAQDAQGNFTQAAKSEIVLIHPGRDQEPIVIASAPGEASSVIQGLKPTIVEVAQAPVESTPEVAESEPEQPAATDSNDSQNTEVAAMDVEPAEVEDAVEEEVAAVETAENVEQPTTLETPARVATAISETADEIEAAVSETAATVEETAEAVSEQVADALSTQDAPAEQVNEAAPIVVAEAETQQAEIAAPTQIEVEPTAQEIATAEAAKIAIEAIERFVQPTIDAIEIDGTMNFIAGAGPDGAIMRLYVDNQYIADAVVADGRWLVETQNVLTKQSQRVRADMLVADTSQVTARTEVNFVVENFAQVPEPVVETPVVAQETTPIEEQPAPAAEQVEVAQATSTAEVALEATPQAEEAVQVAEVTQTAEPAATPEPMPAEEAAADAVEEEVAVSEPPVQTAAQTAPTVQTEPEPAVETSVEVAAEVEEDQPVIEQVEVAQAEPEPAPTVEVAETTQAAPTVESEDAAQASPETQVATITAVAVGEGDSQRFVSGKAIIRKGDNLWTIARRVYGSGVKYTTIYEANANTIANPHMIFPGQVFELPGEE